QPAQLKTLPRNAAEEVNVSEAAATFLSNQRIWSWVTLSLVFALNIVIVSSVFLPNLKEITGFAEAAYINDGRKLVEGELTPFGYSPLSSLLYALTYIPVQGSPYWLIYSCTIGRILLFGLLWTSSYLVASALSTLASPWLMPALLAISPALLYLIAHGSHALFAAMSAFALWQALLFYQTKATRHLVMASVFVGLAVLTRSGEGLILWAVLILLAVWLDKDFKRMAASLAGSVFPCALILGGYILLYYGQVGRFDLGMAEYSYFTFEQGHGLAYQSRYDEQENFYVNGQMDARRLFGTPEENEYSITTAIFRNPSAYLQRVPRLASLAPEKAASVYGFGLALVFFLFALRGACELLRQKLYTLLSILLLWSSYLLVYLLLVFQPTHFLLPYYILFLLASVGVITVVSNFDNRWEHGFWATILVALIAIAITLQKATLFLTASLLLAALVITWMTMARYRHVPSIKVVGVMLVFIPFLIQANHPEPKFRSLGIAEDERAILYMREHLKSGAPVGAYAPINIWMANLTYIPMFRSALPGLNSEQDFSTWMKNNRLAAVYVDSSLKRQEPSVWALVQKRIGHDLKIGFASEKGDIQVLFTAASNSEVDLRDYVDRPWYSSKERFITQSQTTENLHH
ncbi:MAG TPA: hypothetical protein VE616_07910, partial [Candidatus Udaeobacter sp.]|nr:hypothetical protein [Candidatus Udaeobacter sp.]